MVLVTGASGFIGRYLVQHLSEQGTPVRALYYTHPPHASLSKLPHVQWIKCDLLDVYDVHDALQNITEVYHCAAVVSFDARQRERMLHFNTESTANIVNESLRAGIRKMVYVSSVAALGRSDAEKEINEDQEWGESRYNSAYGISKYLAEMEVWRAMGEGLHAVIINPGIVLGVAPEDSLITKMVRLADNEFPFYSGGITSWVDVADVVASMTMLMRSDIHTERFIVSEGNHSFRDVFTMIASELGKKPPRMKAGKFAAGAAWRLSALKSALTGKAPLITRETASNANAKCFYDNKKLLHRLPHFAYTPISQSISALARSLEPANKK